MSNVELTRVNRPFWEPNGVVPVRAGQIVCAFLDTATTSMGRATHYNTRTEQQAAELQAHQDLLGLHRGLYAALMLLPGLTDRSKQLGLKNLLSRGHDNNLIVAPGIEREILYRLFQGLPPTRMLRAIEGFRVGDEELGLKKANNARTRKLILRTLLGSPRIVLWAVKYRRKVRDALVHAWGHKKASAIRYAIGRVLDGNAREADEELLTRELERYAGGRVSTAVEAVGFALGHRGNFQTPMLQSYEQAKTDLSKGKDLPLEVLEGIRGTYHKSVSKAELLELAKGALTKTQRKNVQAQAEKAGVKVDMDPLDYDPVALYLYAFERGCTEEISRALRDKGQAAAKTFPVHYKNVGIVVDASMSMYGHRTQKLRPMAATLALRDMLVHTGDTSVVKFVGGVAEDEHGLVRPQGDTELADALVQVLEHRPDTVFVLSDGYENAPAGRFSEVVDAVREIGIDTPIYHLNPVYSAEAKGVRALAKDVPLMPAQSPAAVGTSFLRAMIEADPVRGINALLDRVVPRELPEPKAKRIVLRPEREVRA